MHPATRNVRESALQAWIVKQVKDRGGFAVKIESPSRRGLPDVLIVISGEVYFAEVKMTTRHKPTAIQSLTHRQMIAAGARVMVVRGLEEAKTFVSFLFDKG